MKKLLLLFSLILAVSKLQAVKSPSSSIQLDEIYDVTFEEKITVDEFIKMDIKQMEKKRGKKLKLKEKVALKIAKRRMKKMKKNGASQSELASTANNGKLYLLPFLLGLCLGPIGVLITWQIWGDPLRTRSSWWGFLVYAIITLLIFSLLLYAFSAWNE